MLVDGGLKLVNVSIEMEHLGMWLFCVAIMYGLFFFDLQHPHYLVAIVFQSLCSFLGCMIFFCGLRGVGMCWLVYVIQS